jgi:hypothetical protein
MRRKTALAILNCAAAFMMLGGCFDMLIPSVPSNLLGYLGAVKADVSAQLSSLLLGLLHALGGCLFAIGMVAIFMINGPVKRGERWASWALVILIGISEGVNASQMWRFGSPYYGPLAFVALTIVGIVLLPNRSETTS